MRQCGSRSVGSIVRGHWGMGTGSFLEGILVSGSELLQTLSLTSWSLASCFVLRRAFSPNLPWCWGCDKDELKRCPGQLQLTTGHSLEWPERISTGAGGTRDCLTQVTLWTYLRSIFLAVNWCGRPRPLCQCLSPERYKKSSWVTSFHSSCPCSCLHPYSDS